MKNKTLKTFVLYTRNGQDVNVHVEYVQAPDLQTAKKLANYNSKLHIIRERVI
jgi:hypothetical protein